AVGHCCALGLLPDGDLVRRGEPSTQCKLRGGAVDASDMCIGDECTGIGSGDERTELLERARADVDTAGSKDDAVNVGSAGIGDLVVQRAPPFVQRAERGLLLGEGTLAAT